jgi:hypothetical protein
MLMEGTSPAAMGGARGGRINALSAGGARQIPTDAQWRYTRSNTSFCATGTVSKRSTKKLNLTFKRHRIERANRDDHLRGLTIDASEHAAIASIAAVVL